MNSIGLKIGRSKLTTFLRNIRTIDKQCQLFSRNWRKRIIYNLIKIDSVRFKSRMTVFIEDQRFHLRGYPLILTIVRIRILVMFCRVPGLLVRTGWWIVWILIIMLTCLKVLKDNVSKMMQLLFLIIIIVSLLRYLVRIVLDMIKLIIRSIIWIWWELIREWPFRIKTNCLWDQTGLKDQVGLLILV